MPYTGEPSFLPPPRNCMLNTRKVCQCPIRANHHFYVKKIDYRVEFKNVSMPYTGEPSFLRKNSWFFNEKKWNCVNALYGRTIISTKEWQKFLKVWMNVSMPYTGEPSFLRILSGARREDGQVVSMPYTGEPSFLQRDTYEIYENMEKMCQCPIRANHHFYKMKEIGKIREQGMCQCPIRANHHFYWSRR